MLPNRVVPMIQTKPAGWLGIDCRAHDAEHVRALIGLRKSASRSDLVGVVAHVCEEKTNVIPTNIMFYDDLGTAAAQIRT